MDDLEYGNLALAEQGQGGVADLTNVLSTAVAEQVIKEVSEGFARVMYAEDRTMIGRPGIRKRYPVKDRSVATQTQDKETILIMQGVLDGVEAEAGMVTARAEWSELAIEANDVALIAEEIEDAKNAIMEFEVKEVVARLTADFDPGNTFAAATAGVLSYDDIVTARGVVRNNRFRLDRIGGHPDQIADLLKDNNLIDSRILTQISPSGDQMWEIPFLGVIIIESTEFTTGTAFGWDSKRAGRVMVKKDITVRPYNGAVVGQAVQGALVMEMIDIITTRPKGIVRITGA